MASLEKMISKGAWNAIKDNYEKDSYTTAIINMLIYAQEIVREKSGLEWDGTALMDKAFFGDKPNLLINKCETKTEKDIQYGIGYILKGLCLAIRNPRAHERYNDDQRTANRIIYFIDYILSFIQDTKYGSLVEDWMDLLFGEDFVGDDEYLDELYKELPKKNQLDLLIYIFRNKERVQSENTVKFIKRVIDGLSDREKENLFDSISKELMSYKNDNGLRAFLFVFPPEFWDKINKLPRLQIEGKIKESFKNGNIDYDSNGFETVVILNEYAKTAISAIRHIKYFSENNKNEIINFIAGYLNSDDFSKKNFVLDHLINFFDFLDECLKNDNIVNGIEKYISDKRSECDERIINLLRRKVKHEKNSIWTDKFEVIFDTKIIGRKSQQDQETQSTTSFIDDIPF